MYSKVLFAATNLEANDRANGHDARAMSFFSSTRAAPSNVLLERGDTVLEHGLLVLRVVVLRVLGDIAELARVADAYSATSRRFSVERYSISSLSFTYPLS